MKKIGIGILALMMVLVVASVYASTCAITKPASSTKYKGNIVYNITNSNAAVVNCTWLVNSVKASDSITFSANKAGGGNYAQTTQASAALLDSNDYTVSATCWNGTRITCSGTKTGITIDNTAPTCAFATGLTSGETYAPEQLWRATCGNTRTASIQFGHNPSNGMSGAASGVCSFTGSKLTVPSMTYGTVVVTLSDYTNSTTCTLTNVVVDDEIGAVEVGALVGNSNQEITTQSTGTVNKNVVLVVIGGLGLLWWIRKKK